MHRFGIRMRLAVIGTAISASAEQHTALGDHRCVTLHRATLACYSAPQICRSAWARSAFDSDDLCGQDRVMTDAGKLSDGEFRVMLRLLQRYADHDLDQWELWRLPSEYGDLFVSLRRSSEPGVDVDAYDDVADFLTGE